MLAETVTAESSLRQRLPALPQSSPKRQTFPVSLFGLYVATEGLSCPDVAQSVIDVLNEQVKWQPLKKTLKSLNFGREEVEGDWEAYFDRSGLTTGEEEMFFKDRGVPIEEEEVLLARWNGAKTVKNDPPGLTELVRKRKMEMPAATAGEGGLDVHRTSKRSKWSHRYRIEEYMKVQGLNLEMNYEEFREKLLIRNLHIRITNCQLTTMSLMLKPILASPQLNLKCLTQQSYHLHLTHQQRSGS